MAKCRAVQKCGKVVSAQGLASPRFCWTRRSPRCRAQGTDDVIRRCPDFLKNVYAVKVGDFQRVRIPPGQSVARPEATRAIEEVTNLLKYSGVTGHLG